MTEAVPCRSLAEYVRALVTRLAAADPVAVARLRRVVGDRRALLTLDDETVRVAFAEGGLVVEPVTPDAAADDTVDGEGATDRATVLDLLDGYLGVADAVLDGRLSARGDDAAVTAMFTAIDILLEASARVPALQALAEDFRADPCRPPVTPRLPGPGRATPWPPAGRPAAEDDLLARLDLLPE